MKEIFKYGLAVGALVAAGVLGNSAQAHLIYEGPIDLQGTGLGNVETILTMTSQGTGINESGKVSWNGSADVVTADPNPPGYTPSGSTNMNGLNKTILLSDTGWTPNTGSGLGIVFNPVEPQNPGKVSITLNNLEMTIYDATTGAAKFVAPWAAAFPGDPGGPPLTLDAIDAGTGNSGYLFALDKTETDQLNALQGLSVNDHIGLLAFATDAQGGHETFFGTVIAHDPDPVPAPAPANTIGLLGIGMIGTAGAIRWNRRRQSQFAV
jgi:hypothetical protein